MPEPLIRLQRLLLKRDGGDRPSAPRPSTSGVCGQANYAASKAGQVGLMKSLSKEVAKRKITVNCVSPGFIATDFIDDLPEARVKEYKKMVPANRFGSPAGVSEAALFLLSDRAAYINGAVLEITGGL